MKLLMATPDEFVVNVAYRIRAGTASFGEIAAAACMVKVLPNVANEADRRLVLVQDEMSAVWAAAGRNQP